MERIDTKLLKNPNLMPEEAENLLCAPENIEIVKDNNHKSPNPFLALTIKDSQLRCGIHHKDYIQVPLKYRDNKGTIYGLQPLYCAQCNCFYVHSSDVGNPFEDHLNAVGVNYKIFDLKMSNHYLLKRIEPEILPVHEVIYTTTDAILDKNPICPLHNSSMETLPYKLVYKERSYQFNGYYCDKCKKIILNRGEAKNIEDACHQNGLPVPTFSSLNDDTFKDNELVTDSIYPQYIVEGGNLEKYNGSSIQLPCLTEEDTLVVNAALECEKGHEINVTARAIQIDSRKQEKEWYVCSIGYCEECDQYIIDEDDFNVLDVAGRLYVKIINNVNSDYLITYGEQFDIEKNHLNDTEELIDKSIKQIRNSTDYAGMYETGSWDDGQLVYKKERSKRDYYPRLKKYLDYRPKPYTYRVDVQLEGTKVKTYYVGPREINIEGNNQVISFNKEPGRTLVAVSTMNVLLDGIQRKVALQRSLDIENAKLYGFNDYKVANDIYEQLGITDRYLRHVLAMRRKQHNLLDIIATIQKNQDDIVHVDMKQNLLVQGCAGSGKTMVLLHRMSYLKENNPEYDFRNALIITPNDRFNIQIQSVAEGLAIDEIRRKSVEQYYIDNLKLFPVEVPSLDKIEAEATADPDAIKYVYSDEFIDDFNAAYVKDMEARNEMIPLLENLNTKLNINSKSWVFDTDAECATEFNNEVGSIRHQIQILSRSASTIKKDIANSQKEYQDNEISIERLKADCEKSYLSLKIITSQELDTMISLCMDQMNDLPRKRQELEESILEIKENKEKTIAELNKDLNDVMDRHVKMDLLAYKDTKAKKYLKGILDRLVAGDWRLNLVNIVNDLSQFDVTASQIYKSYLKKSDDVLYDAGEQYMNGKHTVSSYAKQISDTCLNYGSRIKELNEKLDGLYKHVIVLNRKDKIEKVQDEIDELSSIIKENQEVLSQLNMLLTDKTDTRSFDIMIEKLLYMQEYCKDVKPMVQAIKDAAKKYDNVFEDMRIQLENVLSDLMNGFEHEISEAKEACEEIGKKMSVVENQVQTIEKEAEIQVTKVEETEESLLEQADQLKQKRNDFKVIQNHLKKNSAEEALLEKADLLKNDSPKINIAYTTYINNSKLLKKGITKRYDLHKEIEKLESILENVQDETYISECTKQEQKIEETVDDWNYKKVYQRIYGTLKTAHTGFGKTLYRYDLYVYLLFCLKYFGYKRNNYSFVCVDEAQDISRNEYKLFKQLDSESAIYNLYGDTMQLINTEKGIRDWAELNDVFKFEKYSLNENYRNTNQITQFCNAMFNMKVQQTGVDGVKVREIHRLDLEEYLSKLKVSSDRTAIIISRSYSKDTFIDIDKLPENIAAAISSDELGVGIISLMYIDEIKGIEFDRVFVMPEGMSENEKYIAFTRALSELIIVKEYQA